jgi:hypothetical protein
MEIQQLIDLLISAGGLALAVTYVTGGLIVNLYLSQYGIMQYQVLKVKYLVVGLTYFTNFIALMLLAALPAFFLLAAGSLLSRVVLIVSLLASTSLFLLWGRSGQSKSRRFSWLFWVAAGSLASVFPLMVVIRLLLGLWLDRPIDYEFGLLILLACLAGILSFLGQLYYYSRYLYGKPNVILGAVDPIGMGSPMQIKLTGEKSEISRLSHLDVPMANAETTEDVVLFDETNTHYIIGIPQGEDDYQAVEVQKDIVKAIRYC